MDKGPGYATPLDAFLNGPREEILYVCCVQPDQRGTKSDALATVDVDPASPTYCQIINLLRTGRKNDELHHSGWNICSSCHGKKNCCKRDKLILPALMSDRIYVVDVGKDPRRPTIFKVIESEEMQKLNCSTPHTAHCLATGDIMISVMGDVDGNPKSDYVLVDGKTFTVKGTWVKGDSAKFNYDFWYQPYYDVMVSSEWGAPRIFKTGVHPGDSVENLAFGKSINFYSWSKRQLIQTIDLDGDGVAPLEIRFLHDPKEKQGYVGCAVSSTIIRFYLKDDGTWGTEKVIDIPRKKVSEWMLGNTVNGMITDILISLDDKYLYFSNWLQGDVRQYDISDRSRPKLTGQIFLGGKLVKDSAIQVLDDPEKTTPVEPVYLKGKRFFGGPQMLQLSLDGKRLYVSSSLFSPWDRQFYPETIKEGGKIVKIDVDVENGGMKLDEKFLVDFSETEDGPLLPHEMRYPGGDCTSDIWMADE
ncbi:methanethiol oxidase [Cylas formicarius]|uniref:methanethiol oxidase n=1 Tax=Cylas formicarius TaxID=197179 RepID=UPI0029586344|nr:methanethiol oxidase [Cylas formicarius]